MVVVAVRIMVAKVAVSTQIGRVKEILGKVAKVVVVEGIVATMVAGFQKTILVQATGASASAQEIPLGAMKTNTKKTTIIINSHQKGICLFGIHTFFVPFGIFLFDKQAKLLL